MGLSVNAYVLAATPHWLAASVSSYYDIVSRIVVTYDKDGLGWNRKPLPVTECIEILKGLDRENKMEFVPGSYSRQGYGRVENQNYQRQTALDQASDGADWILQLDTDEVLPDTAAFMRELGKADEMGREALYYPARWLYHHVKEDVFLERSTRFWKIAASFPAPLAVKAHTRLTHMRQSDVPGYRVDFRPQGTDCWSPPEVDSVIPAEHGVVHYAWVRTKAQMALKAANHGELAQTEARDRKQLEWEWCGRHPFFAVATSPTLRRFKGRRMLRLAKIPPPNLAAAVELGLAETNTGSSDQ